MWIRCALCGALVADPLLHAQWHDTTVAAVIGEQTPPPETHLEAPDGD